MNQLQQPMKISKGPLSFNELEPEPVKHELMFVRQHMFRMSIWRGELYELFHWIQLYVLVHRASVECVSEQEARGSEPKGAGAQSEDARKLAAFLDLALEMAFFVEKVL